MSGFLLKVIKDASHDGTDNSMFEILVGDE